MTPLGRFVGAGEIAELATIRSARAAARAKVWVHRSPLADDAPVVVDLDATLIGAHSEKELASQRGFLTASSHYYDGLLIGSAVASRACKAQTVP